MEDQPLRRLPVDFSELTYALTVHFESGGDWEPVWYFDVETGAVIQSDLQAVSHAEEGGDPEDLPEELSSDWETTLLIAGGLGVRFHRVEGVESHWEFALMEAFAEATRTPRLRVALQNALSRGKPFRRFREALDYGGVRAIWFAYRDHALREYATEWIRSLGVDPEDASPRPPDPIPRSW
jgi:hypothetical protein